MSLPLLVRGLWLFAAFWAFAVGFELDCWRRIGPDLAAPLALLRL
jgi:hypothetical protein